MPRDQLQTQLWLLAGSFSALPQHPLPGAVPDMASGLSSERSERVLLRGCTGDLQTGWGEVRPTRPVLQVGRALCSLRVYGPGSTAPGAGRLAATSVLQGPVPSFPLTQSSPLSVH